MLEINEEGLKDVAPSQTVELAPADKAPTEVSPQWTHYAICHMLPKSQCGGPLLKPSLMASFATYWLRKIGV